MSNARAVARGMQADREEPTLAQLADACCAEALGLRATVERRRDPANRSRFPEDANRQTLNRAEEMDAASVWLRRLADLAALRPDGDQEVFDLVTKATARAHEAREGRAVA